MNNIFKSLLLSSLLYSSVFCYEITFSKDFSKSIKQDLLVANVSIEVRKQDENQVNLSISKFAEYIASFAGNIEKINSNPKHLYHCHNNTFVLIVLLYHRLNANHFAPDYDHSNKEAIKMISLKGISSFRLKSIFYQYRTKI